MCQISFVQKEKQVSEQYHFVLFEDFGNAWLEVPYDVYKQVSDSFLPHYGSRFSRNNVYLIEKPDAMLFLYALMRINCVILPRTGISNICDFPGVHIERFISRERSSIRSFPPLNRDLKVPSRWKPFDPLNFKTKECFPL